MFTELPACFLSFLRGCYVIFFLITIIPTSWQVIYRFYFKSQLRWATSTDFITIELNLYIFENRQTQYGKIIWQGLTLKSNISTTKKYNFLGKLIDWQQRQAGTSSNPSSAYMSVIILYFVLRTITALCLLKLNLGMRWIRDKGSSIKDVTQFLIFFDTPYAPSPVVTIFNNRTIGGHRGKEKVCGLPCLCIRLK